MAGPSLSEFTGGKGRFGQGSQKLAMSSLGQRLRCSDTKSWQPRRAGGALQSKNPRVPSDGYPGPPEKGRAAAAKAPGQGPGGAQPRLPKHESAAPGAATAGQRKQRSRQAFGAGPPKCSPKNGFGGPAPTQENLRGGIDLRPSAACPKILPLHRRRFGNNWAIGPRNQKSGARWHWPRRKKLKHGTDSCGI